MGLALGTVGQPVSSLKLKLRSSGSGGTWARSAHHLPAGRCPGARGAGASVKDY